MARTLIINDSNKRSAMKRAWDLACELVDAGKQVKVTVSEHKSKRSLEQNARLWAMLGDIAEQVEWSVNGQLRKLSPEDWKTILTAGMSKEQKVAHGIDGGFVFLGQSTSKMTVAQMTELMEYIAWFGADRGVEWSEISGDSWQ